MNVSNVVRPYYLIVFLMMALLPFSSINYAMEPTMLNTKLKTKPKVIVFDVNETLLDLAPLKVSVGQAISGREDLLPLWFSTMLHYSLVETVTGNYQDFAKIGTAALLMIAEKEGIDLNPIEAHEAIVGTITQLPPHADVKKGLEALSKQGFKVVSLTNSSNAGVAAQFEFAGLTSYFSRRFSVEDVKAFKPAAKPYLWLLEELDVLPEDVLMVAAHAWDLAGAKAVGLQTAFIKRPGAVLYPNVSNPDYVVDDLSQLVLELSRLP